jgi:uncharacterized membrane protein YphA (DoxX/SURF4 family)
VKHVYTIARYLLGLIFVVFGLNGFFSFLPPPEMAGYLPIMVASGYLAVVKILEITGGVLLLANIYPRLALVLLGPVVVNIVLYHLYFDPVNGVPGYLAFVLTAILVWGHRRGFAPVFVAKADPA